MPDREEKFFNIIPDIEKFILKEPLKNKNFILNKDPDVLKLNEGVADNIRRILQDYQKANPDSRFTTEELERYFREFAAFSNFTPVSQGQEKEVLAYIRQNFGSSLFILFQTLKADDRIKEALMRYITGRDLNDGLLANQYRIRLQAMKAQRELLPEEEEYLASVESLSKFNPYMVAVLSEAPGESYEYLSHHFNRLTSKTWGDIEEGDYIPQIHIGTGPEGVAWLGEQARLNPALASETLIVDKGDQPGGPFAIPGGPGWELNSKNGQEMNIYQLPNVPRNSSELRKSVRGYASPLKWYPGERRTKDGVPEVTRPGSINMATDYGPSTDMISGVRYPTNEDLQLILAAQVSMFAKRVCMKTEVISVTPLKRKQNGGNKKVVLKRTLGDGSVEVRTVYTNRVVNATGLGEPYYGFETETTSGGDILKKGDLTPSGFPRICHSSEAFKYIASRREGLKDMPETIAIAGTGDSAATIIEALAGQFKTGNPAVRNIKRIYVLSEETNLSQRPRYAKLRDLFERFGKKDLVEFVNVRISDLQYSKTNPTKLNFLGKNGGVIRAGGAELQADSYIAATGYKRTTTKMYGEYKMQNRKLATQNISLPTNSQITIGETLEADNNILFIGTSVDPSFNEAKLGQLPRESRDVLERVGAENGVAIGFRSPEAQAAARIVLSRKESIPLTETTKKQKQKFSVFGNNKDWKLKLYESPIQTIGMVKNPIPLLEGIIANDIVNIGIDSTTGFNINFSIEEINGEYILQTLSAEGVSDRAKKVINEIFAEEMTSGYLLECFKTKKKGNKKLFFNINYRPKSENIKRPSLQVSIY